MKQNRFQRTGLAFAAVVLAVQVVPARAEDASVRDARIREIISRRPDPPARLEIPEDAPTLHLTATPLSEGQAGSVAAVATRYDSMNAPSIVLGTETSTLGNPTSFGEDYFVNNGKPLEIVNFVFLGGVSPNPQTIRVTFFDLRGNVSLDFTANLTAGGPGWDIGLGSGFVIPGQGYVLLSMVSPPGDEKLTWRHADVSNGMVGFNDPSTFYVDGNKVTSSFAPKVLAFLLNGDSVDVPPEPSDSNCCGPRLGQTGCDDAECEARVCLADTFCCNAEWDFICHEEALDLCPEACNLKNRFISFKVRDLFPETFKSVRIRIVNIYDESICPPGRLDLDVVAGECRWALPFGIIPEFADGAGGPPFLNISFTVFLGVSGSWRSLFPDGEAMHLFGPEIVPCSTYTVNVYYRDCFMNGFTYNHPSCYSSNLLVRTAIWGDVVPGGGPVSFTDIGAVVKRFKGIVPPSRLNALLRDQLVPYNKAINFTDIGRAVKAFKSIPYGEAVPLSAPGTCGRP